MHELDAGRCGNIWKANQASVRPVFDEDEVTEIGIEGYQDSLLACGLSENSAVAWIGTWRQVGNVMAFGPEPIGEPPTGAAINQKLHLPVWTASSRS